MPDPKPKKITLNHMAKVKCPVSGEVEWGNSTQKGGYRCCKCGQLHQSL